MTSVRPCNSKCHRNTQYSHWIIQITGLHFYINIVTWLLNHIGFVRIFFTQVITKLTSYSFVQSPCSFEMAYILKPIKRVTMSNGLSEQRSTNGLSEQRPTNGLSEQRPTNGLSEQRPTSVRNMLNTRSELSAI